MEKSILKNFYYHYLIPLFAILLLWIVSKDSILNDKDDALYLVSLLFAVFIGMIIQYIRTNKDIKNESNNTR